MLWDIFYLSTVGILLLFVHKRTSQYRIRESTINAVAETVFRHLNTNWHELAKLNTYKTHKIWHLVSSNSGISCQISAAWHGILIAMENDVSLTLFSTWESLWKSLKFIRSWLAEHQWTYKTNLLITSSLLPAPSTSERISGTATCHVQCQKFTKNKLAVVKTPHRCYNTSIEHRALEYIRTILFHFYFIITLFGLFQANDCFCLRIWVNLNTKIPPHDVYKCWQFHCLNWQVVCGWFFSEVTS